MSRSDRAAIRPRCMTGWHAPPWRPRTGPGAARPAGRITKPGARYAKAAAPSAPCTGARPAPMATYCRLKCSPKPPCPRRQPRPEETPMFETTLAGSLPKPSWLATPNVLWAPWTLTGQPLQEAKEDATALSIRRQEEAGIDIVSDGEQARQHFVHGFLAEVDGVDFDKKVRMGIRNNRYEADCPTVTSALKRRRFVHEKEARVARATTARKLKFTLPGPMTLIDTLADGHYGERVKMAFAFAELLNQEAKDLEKLGVDVIQFDEPAFNVYLAETVEWGVPALEKAAEGLKCTTAVHICYGYGIEANIKWKETLGESWRQYENTFPALDRSRISQVSLECRQSHVPPELMKLLKNKTVLVGCIDVASDRIDTPEEVAATLKLATQFVDPER